MAILKFGAIVTEGSGSLGGHTIQHSKGGMQLRTKPIPSGQPSATQSLIRLINPQLQAGWRSLTDEQRKIWNDWPVTRGIMNTKGDHKPLSGHSLWMKWQFNQLINGYPFLFDPSLFKQGPELITSFINSFQAPYSILTTLYRDVTFAQSITAWGACLSVPTFNVLSGDKFILKVNSHSSPGLIIYGKINIDIYWTAISSVPQLTQGINQYILDIFTSTPSVRLVLLSSSPLIASYLNVSLKKILP